MSNYSGPGYLQSNPNPQLAAMTIPKVVQRVTETALWSTFQFANASAVAGTTARTFQVALGGNGQGLPAAASIAETNMREGGRIVNAAAYAVNGCACAPYYDDDQPVDLRDLLNLQNNAILSWQFIQVEIEIAPISLIGAGGGVFGSTSDVGANYGTNGSQVALNNGAGNIWMYSHSPILLPSGTTFSLDIKWGSSAVVIDGGGVAQASNLRVKNILLGTYRTAVPAA